MFPRYTEYEVDAVGTTEVSGQDAELLDEIRSRYEYACDAWKSVRDERNVDMRYVCGDPWEPEDRKARADKQARRPCISHDELGQYINQSLNNIRQNKRGIKVEPAGEGASEQSAEYRQNRIRAIEYRSKAQSAYETAYQHMIEGSYGFWRIAREYVSNEKDNWDQEIVIKPIQNPDSVLYDPDCKEPDWSDARWCFVVESMPKDEFKRRYPRANISDFTVYDDTRINSTWVTDKTVLVAEYWKVEIDSETQTRKGSDGKPKKRTVFCKHVRQYVTNGVEILEQNDQPGDEIPIIACIGLERYLNDGTTTSRKIFSLVRLARDAQMTIAYLVSLQAEAAGLMPKTPWIAYVGQLETDRDHWQNATKIPYPFLLVDPIPDSANGQILPLPQRQIHSIDFGSFEVGIEAARRAVQAAMGISPLPTAAMRANEKSGIAIQKIQSEMALGSYHFVDNFERALERCGRIIESWLPLYDDTEREVSLCAADGKRSVVRINAPVQFNPQTGGYEPGIQVEEGEHDVTISVGPSNQSQRDAASDFLEVIVSNLQNLVAAGIISPQAGAKLFAESIKNKQLGPWGDEMADTISPPDQGQGLPPQVQQMMQAAQGQMQQAQQYIAQLEQEKQAKVIENQGKVQIEQIKAAVQETKSNNDLAMERLKLEMQLAVAEVQAKTQYVTEHEAIVADVLKQLHSHAHEVGMQAHSNVHERQVQETEHAHERDMAEQQATIAQAQAAQQADQSAQQGGM